MTDNEQILQKQLQDLHNRLVLNYNDNVHFKQLEEDRLAVVNAIDQINRQKAEIENYQKYIEHLNFTYDIKGVKAEAIKEFAAKIKGDAEWICDDSYIEDALTEYIDNLVKETVGDV